MILLSRAVFRGPCVTPGRAAREAADLAFADEDTPYAAVAVLGPTP